MLGDTIWAQSSAAGESARAVLRISGPQALAAVAAVSVAGAAPPRRRGLHRVELRVFGEPCPALALCMPGPASFTGEDVVELHLPGSPRLVEVLGRGLEAVARPATPGEFTRRAWEHGRLDLVGAEAVLAMVHADSVAAAAQALHTLRGGLVEALRAVREELLGAAALVEAGLDFDSGETGEVPVDSWLPQVVAAAMRLDGLAAELPRGRGAGGVLLLGHANAGKSTLCNALAGRDAVLVSAQAGTTRDVLHVQVDGIDLYDAPGDLEFLAGPDAGVAVDVASGSGIDTGAIDRAALELRAALAARCAAMVLVVDPRDRRPAPAPPPGAPPLVAVVATHADVAADAALPPGSPTDLPVFRVGSPTGRGLAELRGFLAGWAGAGPAGGGAGHDARGRSETLVATAREALQRVLDGAAEGLAAELAAVELGAALEALAEVGGESGVPEELLDRIFGRFCLGK